MTQDTVSRLAVPTQVVQQVLNRPLFSIGNTPVTPGTLAAFAVILVVTWLISLLLQRATTRGLSLRSKADPSTVTIASRLIHYAVLLIGLGIALQTIGINVAALFAAGAFFAVALGFAMQNVAENFVAGVILMTERTIKPGDILHVSNTMVRVTHLGLRATVGRSRDEEDLIIPNSVLVQNIVTNYTLRDSIIRVRASVGVSYGSDVALVMRVLHEAAKALPAQVAGHEPVVLLTGFGDSSVNFEVSAWVSDPWASRRIIDAARVHLVVAQAQRHQDPVPATRCAHDRASGLSRPMPISGRLRSPPATFGRGAARGHQGPGSR